MITRSRLLGVAVLAVLAGALFAGPYLIGTLSGPTAPVGPPETRAVFPLPEGVALDALAVSPDGRAVAYSSIRPSGAIDLSVTSLGGGPPMAIRPAGDQPFFSPDGKSIAIFTRGELWRTPVNGDGPGQKICDAPGEHAGGTWTEDGRIVFAPLGGVGLMSVPASGGTPTAITTLSKRAIELAHGWPHALPGGAVLFTVSQRGRDPHLEVLSSANERSGRLVPAVGQAQYASSGQLVYSYLGDLYAVRFNLREAKTEGAPMVVARGVQTSSGFDQLGRSAFALSPNGTMVWVRSSPQDLDAELVKVGFDGAQVTPLGAPAAPYQTPRISPDGRRIAVAVRSALMTRELRVLDRAHPERVLFSIQGGDNQSPAWMPDGRLSFASNRAGLQKIYVASRDGKAIEPLFSVDVTTPRNPSAWRKQPALLALYEIDPFRARDVLVYHVGEAILPVAATQANERSPVLSPDGRSIAFVSDASGRDEVYVKSVDDQSEPKAISTGGGVEPVWTAAGLFYREGDRLMTDEGIRKVQRGPELSIEGRFEKDPGANGAAYDVDVAGKSVLLLRGARRPKELQVVRGLALISRRASTSPARADSAAAP